jgi:protein kinase/serine/threonine-protein kinase
VLALVLLGVWWLWSDVGGPGPSTEPGAETNATAAEVASAAHDTTDRPRIAVLPFENIARDSANAFFTEGMHEEVLSQLSKVSGLEVISRTSVMQYGQTNKTVQKISEELGGVDALLEGSVRRAGDQVRITTQLIGAPEDEHLWSSTYERRLSVEEIFDVQADIAEQIAASLETRLTASERQRIEDAPTDDLAAYEAYLRGRGQVLQFIGQWTTELLDRATENLREAVRRDSTFAEAYAWLAQAHRARIINLSAEEAPRWLDSASVAVERARQIDPDLAAVYGAQALIYRARDDSLQAAAAALRKALKLQPSYSMAKAALSVNLADRGKLAEGVRIAREAVRLDPRRPVVLKNMGDRLEDVGLHGAAEAWYRHTLEIEPSYATAHAGLASNEMSRGRPERALALWQDYFDQAGSPPTVFYQFAAVAALAAGRPERARDYLRQQGDEAGLLLGHVELRLGHNKRGHRLLRQGIKDLRGEIERGARLNRPYGMWLAGALATLGRTGEALQEVERAAKDGPAWGRDMLRWYPTLDTLRSVPQFQEIALEIEARREEAREQVRRMDIDLYPPGTKPDSERSRPQTDA